MNKADTFKTATDEIASMGFFQPREKIEPIKPNIRTVERPNERIPERVTEPTNERPQKRYARRQSFEIYDDQMDNLKKLRREAEERDENLPISKMVRDAIDAYLKKRTVERPNV